MTRKHYVAAFCRDFAQEVAVLASPLSAPPQEPTGASPQAETREDMGDGRETALKLEQALRMLRNECHAIMAMSYDAIKDSAGYTNLKVWLSRVEEADALLASPLSAPPTARSAPPAA